MSEVFLCETGQLNATAKHDLRKAGIVVVEVPDPSRCQFIRATETISGDDMLWAALHALSSNQDLSGRQQREQLALNMLSIVRARRAPGQPT